MLILCYGITKSGSTLTFELIKGMLESIGHKQDWVEGAATPGHRINFIEFVDKASLAKLLAAIPGERMIAVKTHSSINRHTFMWLEELQTQRKLQIVASYRDPRDICLSLVDAGRVARARGTRPFSEYSDLASTLPSVKRQILTFQKWASIKGALRLNYETVAFSSDQAIDTLERVLGIKCDRDHAKRHAFNKAFTHKNKGIMRRHARELSEQQAQELMGVFGPFIQTVCTKNDDLWFSAFREEFLAKAAARRG